MKDDIFCTRNGLAEVCSNRTPVQCYLRPSSQGTSRRALVFSCSRAHRTCTTSNHGTTKLVESHAAVALPISRSDLPRAPQPVRPLVIHQLGSPPSQFPSPLLLEQVFVLLSSTTRSRALGQTSVSNIAKAPLSTFVLDSFRRIHF